MLAWLILSMLLVAAAVLFVRETRGSTLSFDEWTWALHRRGASLATYLAPHNGHLSLIPITLYRLLFATFGLNSYAPYRALVIGAHLGCVVLLFAYARARVPSSLALLAAAVMLFLGPAWQNFLWPFQIAWLISIGAGLAAFMLLDRHDRLGDVTASVLLAISLASSGLGLAVTIGAGADILWRRTRWTRVWIVAAPLALYAVWWGIYQDSSVADHALFLVPSFVATAASATLAALAGLSGPTVPFGSGTLLDFGPPLALLAVILIVWRLRRAPDAYPRAVALLAVTVSFWMLAALGRGDLVQGYDSRYLYVGAIFLIALAVELARGITVPPWTMVGLSAIAVASITSNIGVLRDVRAFQRGEAEATAADLGALDIGRPLLASSFVASHFPWWPAIVIDARSYFATEKAYGTPAATPAQIVALPEGAREVADSELISIHRIGLQASSSKRARATAPTIDLVAGGFASTRGGCVVFVPQPYGAGPPGGELDVILPASGIRITPVGAPATVAVRRFSTRFQPVGTVNASSGATLAIAPDLAAQPWHVRISPSDRVTVCGLS